MIARKKQPKPSRTGSSAHTVQCVYCNKTMLASDTGWVVNGLGVVLCHSLLPDDCFSSFRKESEAARGKGVS
jgi:hypothetical protein